VKTQVIQLKESLSCVLRAASYTLQQNHYIDTGLLKTVEIPGPRFEKTIEEFFSICDQIEYNLKTAIECQQQGILLNYLNKTIKLDKYKKKYFL